jgi:hypothetical protein
MPAKSKLIDAEDFGAVLSAVALNGAAATRTAEITLNKRFTRITLTQAYTYSAATSVTLTPSKSIDGGTTYGQYTSKSISDGVATVSAYTEVVTGTSSWAYETTLDVEGVDKLKIVYSGGGTPGAGDLLTVKATGTLVSQ